MVASTTDLCDGDSLTLTFNVNGTPPFDLYYNDGIVNYTVNGASNGHIEVFFPATQTTFTFDSAIDGVGNPILVDQTVVVDVKPGASAQYFVSGSQLTYNFINQSTVGSTVTWDFGDGNTQVGGSFVSHTYATAGVYNACITAEISNGCTDTYCDSIFAGVTSIEEFSSSDFRVYPNPAKDQLSIEIKAGKKGDFILQLSSADGKTVIQDSFIIGDGNEAQLDLSQLSPGFYILRIQDQSGSSITQKVIIE